MIKPSLLFRPLFFCLALATLLLSAETAGAVTFEKRTAASTDDAEEFISDGSIYISSTDLELIHDTSDQVVGMRWTGVTVPQGATITAAYIQFWAKETQSEVTNVLFNGQAADNPATFNTTHLSISTRPRTSASTAWSIVPWTSTDGQGANQRTPSLVPVIQEIVNRPGWASGNAMVIVVTGSGHRCAWAWDGNTAQSPLLHIEYTTAPVNNAPVARLSVTQPATPPLTVNANGSASTDTDAFPIATYQFNFGDGTPTVTANAPTATATHAYASPGTYTVSLVCTDTGNLSSPPVTQSITVQPENPPVAQLAVSQPATPPLTALATAAGSTDGDLTPIASYRFDFGDGTPTATVSAPTVTASHAYASAGPYTVTLIAVDTGGNASAPVTRGITIQPENPPAAALVVTQLASPALTVNADATGSTDGDLTPIASYRFDFGDGTPTATGSAPTKQHTYGAAGRYTVSVIAVDTGNNASTPATQSIEVVPQDDPPVARLTVTQPATPPLTVHADASASTDGDLTPIASYAFDFGDGTPTVTASAGAATATHAYAAAGPYTITLIATDTGGKASAPVTKSITIQAENAPVAHLSLSQPATPPSTVVADGGTSTDSDLTPIASYAFDFGDGTPTVTASAPTATASHAYAAAGSYTVTLIVTDTGGNPSAPTSQEITVQADDPPIASLGLTQASSPFLTANADGSFSSDGDLTPIASYRFDFGDGTPTVTVNAPTATAKHTYAAAGTYFVTLRCTDTGGLVSEPATEQITIEAPPEAPPVAQLSVTRAPVPELKVNADGSGSTDGDLTPIASYAFDFGDGTPTVTANAPTATASHTYATLGTYTVTLIVTDTGGNRSSPVTQSITVLPPDDPPVARLSVSQPALPALTVNADGGASTDTDFTPIASYRFDFGDGTPTVTANAPTATASHAYAGAGTYTVTLIAVDTGGNPSVPVTKSITIQPDNAPVAQLAVSQVAIPPLTVNADASGSTDGDLTPIATYRFDFGDGTPTVTVNAPTATASHTYLLPGSYTVKLIAVDAGALASAPATRSIDVSVDAAPTARLSVTQPPTPPLTVNADGSASTDGDLTPIATYRFNFGDGTPTVTANAPSATASHAYASAGTYTVTLIAVDTGGNASPPATQTITVQAENAPVARLTVAQPPTPPLTVNADGSTSTDGDLTPIATYRFNFGDGTATVTATAPSATASHVYAAGGTYTVTLIAVDTGGNASPPATQTITVQAEAAPVARLTVTQPPSPPLTVNASGSTSTDGDLTPIATYRFNFGDGTATVTATAPSSTASHVYAAAGTYTVTLICTDTGGLASPPATQSITVQAEAAPVARLTVTPNQTPGLVVTADGSTSTDGDLTPIASYRFSFGDGTATVTATAPSATAQHTYASAGTYTVTLIVTDTANLSSAPVTASVTVSNAVAPIDKRTVASSDDAEQQGPTGSTSLTSSDLELVHDSVDQIIGIRWTGINIPKGATINSAYIQFGAKESQSEVTNLTIRGEAADNSATYTTGTGNVTSRTRTNSYVNWSPVAWNSTDGQGPNQRTPDLAFPIQEIVNRAGWASGNALSMIINGTGHRTAWAFDGSASNCPLLHIVYNSGPPPADQAPVARLSVAAVGMTANADGSASTDGDLTPIASYRFTFGDGTPAVVGSSATASHTYTTAGTYTVTLTCTDTNSLTSAPVTQSVTVSSGTGGGGSGVAVYVGYYDTHHTDNLHPKPSVWQGSSNTTFVGTVDPGTTNGWDTSAIRVDNLGTSSLTGVGVTVDMGSHHFALWSSQSIPAGGRLILAQTGFENFDGSDTSPAGCFSCDPNDCLTKVSSAIPVVHVTIGGVTTNYPDPGQVMNTHGVDGAGCPYTGTRNDESSDWVRVFAQTGSPSARAQGTGVTAPVHPELSWLAPPFPNPSHGSLEVKFRTNYASHFRLGVYDISGRLQRELSQPDLEAGDYLEQINLRGLPAGMYYLSISSPEETVRHPFVLVN